MKKAVIKACQAIGAGLLVLAIGTTALPHALAAESTELQESAEALAESITQAVIETFTDEALIAPYEYAPYEDLTVITGYTAEELEALLEDSGLEGLGAYYAEKEQTHGINALFLISVAQLESGFGNSSLARNCNNLGGIKNGMTAIWNFRRNRIA